MAAMGDGRLSTADLIQQMALLSWTQGNEGGKEMLEKIVGFRVVYELWQRISSEQEIEALKAQTILSIADYVKRHPRVSEEELAKEVTRQIKEFVQNLENI